MNICSIWELTPWQRRCSLINLPYSTLPRVTHTCKMGHIDQNGQNGQNGPYWSQPYGGNHYMWGTSANQVAIWWQTKWLNINITINAQLLRSAGPGACSSSSYFFYGFCDSRTALLLNDLRTSFHLMRLKVLTFMNYVTLCWILSVKSPPQAQAW